MKNVKNHITVYISQNVVLKDFVVSMFLFFQGDRTFTFEINSPPVSHFLKAAAGIEKGAQKPGELRHFSFTKKIEAMIKRKMVNMELGQGIINIVAFTSSSLSTHRIHSTLLILAKCSMYEPSI